VLSPLRDQAGDVGGLPGQALGTLIPARPGRCGVIDPAREFALVVIGHAEQFADHGHRQPAREHFHQVRRLACLDHGRDQFGSDLLSARPEAFHAARGERLGDQSPHPGVFRRIHVQQPEWKEIGNHPGLIVTAGLRPAETRVAEHRLHVVVPGDQPRGFAIGHADQAQRLVLLQVPV
jgi:hypothetical protein